MIHLRAFIAAYFGNGSDAPKYATGLKISEDEEVEQDEAPKYATGLEIPEDDQPQEDAEPKYATGLKDDDDEEEAEQDEDPKYATGLKDSDDEEVEQDEAPKGKGPLGLGASVGRGGQNDPDDVLAVQKALNRRLKAGVSENGECDSDTLAAIEEFQQRLGQFKPSGLIEPGRGAARALAGSGKLPPPPEPPRPIAPPKLGKATLATAPAVWRGTRDILETNIAELQKGVLAHYGNEHPDVLNEIEAQLTKLGAILGKLDHRLADSLASAHAAGDDAARAAELKNSKAILMEYISYVKSEPMIAHVDDNPFGVDTQLRQVLMDALTHMAKSIG